MLDKRFSRPFKSKVYEDISSSSTPVKAVDTDASVTLNVGNSKLDGVNISTKPVSKNINGVAPVGGDAVDNRLQQDKNDVDLQSFVPMMIDEPGVQIQTGVSNNNQRTANIDKLPDINKVTVTNVMHDLEFDPLVLEEMSESTLTSGTGLSYVLSEEVDNTSTENTEVADTDVNNTTDANDENTLEGLKEIFNETSEFVQRCFITYLQTSYSNLFVVPKDDDDTGGDDTGDDIVGIDNTSDNGVDTDNTDEIDDISNIPDNINSKVNLCFDLSDKSLTDIFRQTPVFERKLLIEVVFEEVRELLEYLSTFNVKVDNKIQALVNKKNDLVEKVEFCDDNEALVLVKDIKTLLKQHRELVALRETVDTVVKAYNSNKVGVTENAEGNNQQQQQAD